MGGKGKKRSEGYAVCSNPSCGRDWRYYRAGPDCCRYCKCPFRIPAWAVGEVGTGGGGGGGTGGGGNGGAAGGSGWKVQDSKGRARDLNHKEWPLPSPQSKPKGRGAKNVSWQDQSESVDDLWLANLYREQNKDHPEKIKLLEEVFPPAPKTDADILRDGIAAVERAEAGLNHISKVCSDMEVSAQKKIEELLEYKDRLQAHRERRDAANEALKEARAELAKLQSVQAPAAGQVTVLSADPRALVASYNPIQNLADSMESLEGFSQIPPSIAQSLQGGIQQLMQHHMHLFATSLIQQPAPPVQPPVAPAVSDVSGTLAGGGVVDENMLPTVAGKRSWETLHNEDEDLDLGFDESQGANSSSWQNPSAAASTPAAAATNAEDTISMLQRVADSATAAVCGKLATPGSNQGGQSCL